MLGYPLFDYRVSIYLISPAFKIHIINPFVTPYFSTKFSAKHYLKFM